MNYLIEDKGDVALPYPRFSPVCFTFHQSQTKVTLTTKRSTLYELIRGIGALKGFTTLVATLTITKM